MCYPVRPGRDTCQDRDIDEKRSDRCVQELGGDAKQSVRFAIGFTVLGVAIAIDLAVRIFTRKAPQDEYSHL
jgi:hypothetical protein